MQALPSSRLTSIAAVRTRLQEVDWAAIERDLSERGWATTPPLLTAEECAELVALYSDDARFRSRVENCKGPTNSAKPHATPWGISHHLNKP